MKILVIGSTGMVGSRVVDEALSRGHEVVAASRSERADTPRTGETHAVLDLADTDALKSLASEADVAIAAVSPRSTGDAEAEAAAYADALIAGLGSSRLVLVGGAGSLNLPDGTPVANIVAGEYAAEARGMRVAYEKIAASGLSQTTLAPAALIQPGQKTGKFRLGGRTLLKDANGDSKISAEDYAVALLDEIETPKHTGEIFTVAY